MLGSMAHKKCYLFWWQTNQITKIIYLICSLITWWAVLHKPETEKQMVKGAEEFFFWRLSSRYSCNICSWTDTHQHHTHLTHIPYTQIDPTTTPRFEDRILKEITARAMARSQSWRVEIKGVVRSSTSKQYKEKIDERQLMILDNRSVQLFGQLACCQSSRAWGLVDEIWLAINRGVYPR
jgi:hypothetical protein